MSSKKFVLPTYKVRLVRDRVTLRSANNFEAAKVLCQLCCCDESRETMWVLYLDGHNNVVGAEQVAQGGRHGFCVTACEIMRGAIICGATRIILGHNHPSGDVTPSVEDRAMTRALEKACSVVGVPLADHLVVAASGNFSSCLDDAAVTCAA